MRNYYLFFLVLIFLQPLHAQKQQFKTDWEIIDSLEVKGLVQDALQKTNGLSVKAQRKKDYDNYIKAQLFRWKFIQTTEENANTKIVNEVNQTIAEVPFPYNAIVEVYKAKFLNTYYQENQWQIFQRKATDNANEDDLESWSLDYLLSTIRTSYKNALKNGEELAKIPVEQHVPLIDALALTRNYRPTLYDLLAYDALAFFETDFYYVTRPEETFSPSAETLFAPSPVFQKQQFETSDSLYSKVNVFRSYQQLERLHSTDKNPAAFVFAQLNRYAFATEFFNSDAAWELYLDRLNALSKTYSYHSIKRLIKYHLALAYHKRADEKDLENHLKNPDFNTKAAVLCEEVLKEFPNSDIAGKCAQLLDIINEVQLDAKVAAYAVPNAANRLFLEYSNMDSVSVHIARVEHDFSDDYFPHNNYKENINRLKNILKNTGFYTKTSVLLKAEDHNVHSTELVLPALELGTYLIGVSAPGGLEAGTFSYGVMHITNLSINATNHNSYALVQALDRKTGAPIEQVNLRFEDYQKHLVNKDMTNSQGFARINKPRRNNSISAVRAIKNGDTLSTHLYVNPYYERENQNLEAKTLLFLDRSIYRPGQKVYFKGILLQRKEDSIQVVPNEFVHIIVDNANGDELEDFRLKTNDFGSVSGEFTLPKGDLTGNFSIYAEEDDADSLSPFWKKIDEEESYSYNEISFNVEEYKRPTFEVVFDDIKEAYHPEDSVKITGMATSFLGAKLAQTQVIYEVYRSSYYKTWWRSGNSGRTQIARDTLTTTSDGNFTIPFLAMVDPSIQNTENLVYEYQISATVTDVNGETRENSTTLKMGDNNLIADLILSQQVEKGDSLSLTVKAKNLNDNPVTSEGTLAIYKLKAPDRVLQERLWAAPEIQQILEQDFVKLFPNEPYDQENLKEYWEKDTLVITSQFETDGTFNTAILTDNSWKSGVYSAEVELQSENLTTSVRKYFTLMSSDDDYLPDHQRFSFKIINSDFKYDGFAQILVQTAYTDLNLNVYAYNGDKEIFFKQLNVDGKASIKIPLEKEMGNAVKIGGFGVKNGASIVQNETISLKTKEKTLAFETKTFRDKLQPGVEEQWSFSLKNENNEIPDAEILASMYDASLDQFTPHSWETEPNFYSNTQDFPEFHTYTLSAIEHLRTTFYNSRQLPGFFDNFDQLNLFGFTFGQINSHEYKRYLASLRKGNLSNKNLTGNTRGKVTDENGDPLPGVQVLVKNTTTGTQTNFDGEFGLDAEAGDLLTFNTLGFTPTEITVREGQNIFVMLQVSEEALEEVVTVGYGVAEMPVGAALQGKAAGVSVSENNQEITIRGASTLTKENAPIYVIDGEIYESEAALSLSTAEISSMTILKNAEATALYGAQGANGAVIITTKKALQQVGQVEARKNLKETAFFLPQLTTDKNGTLSFNFTSPEALTRWKFDMLAHDKNYTIGSYTQTVITQKDLNIVPNAPRFLREGDTINFQAKVANMTDSPMTGVAVLQLFDATTMQPIDSLLHLGNSSKNFGIKAKNSDVVSWQIQVPSGIPAVTYRVLAKAGNSSDGEENLLPVLTNRMMITESLPLFVRGGEKETFTFENLKNNDSKTLKNHQFTLEYTSNPAWYAIQSLPYLMEFPHECSEQVFARHYANSLGAHIINSQPKIKEVFKSWEAKGTLTSNLKKNDELKSLIIEETPWLRDAESETERKNRIAQLFELKKLASQQQEALISLKQKQNGSGAWPWFSGGKDNYYITRHIVAGFGHLNKLGVTIDAENMLEDAISWMDEELIRQEKKYMGKNKDGATFYTFRSHLHHLYARSFFLEQNKPSPQLQALFNKIIKAQKEDWLSISVFEKGLFALSLERMGDSAFAKKILENLKQTAVLSDNNGMYWKDNRDGWHWYEAPIETHALLIEAFETIANDPQTVEELKIWLLQNKRSNSWPTTKATTEAAYALLLQGTDWLPITDNTTIKLGGETLKTSKMKETEKEAGTGYLKLKWNAEEMNKKFAEIEVKNNNRTAGYGGVYWQYFENLDKIKSHDESPLHVEKELYLNVNEGQGTVLKKIGFETPVKVGDLVTVRLVVKSNAAMEFIHLKDMRASGFEPTNVLSEYKYQDGTAYYESTKDAATHFFFDELQQGTYVLEYTVRANNAGNFSNGITLIESMYAPEFSNHTQGIPVNINEN